MPMELYPLQFKPILKERIWGGTQLESFLNKPVVSKTTGESWEISGLEGDVSIVSKGVYAGESLNALISKYPVEMLGAKVYATFGEEFPLLFKFLDAKEDLSIQVHPNDTLAKERHNANGKTEMWYVVQAEENARLIVGFKEDASKEAYLECLKNKSLTSILDDYPVKAGDVFYLETGTVHAIGAGTLIAEIQQSSDITYRIYDFDRKDANGNLRELHVDFALDAINYKKIDVKKAYEASLNKEVSLVDSPYFSAAIIDLDGVLDKNNSNDSFVVYMCVGGVFEIQVEDKKYEFQLGDSVLIPAALTNFQLSGQAKLLEINIS
ncbi:type I phosphomannose isomerase catalytic subunit [Flavobacterium sp.]|uniref:type I phosphomannose isomerase catalytic subunit n=1 Tax=Flavobacterium sp. TaxID=239 RepID=UPI003D113617